MSSLSASCGSSCPGLTLRRPSCSWSNSLRCGVAPLAQSLSDVRLLAVVHRNFLCVFQDVCKIVVNYCHILKERVRVLSENSDHGSAINMVSPGNEKKTFLMLQNTDLP